jgi:type IV pilus assembly protein PilA
MKSMQKGFTLIELMIVVAIIAILAAIAIPAYQDYITKSQFTESQTVADGMKTPILEYYNQTGACPTVTTVGGGLAANVASYAGKYVANATAGGTGTATGGCTIDVLFKGTPSVSTPLNAAHVLFTATSNGGSFTWACSSAVADKFKPQVCRAGQ